LLYRRRGQPGPPPAGGLLGRAAKAAILRHDAIDC
jgi:hypothetical protein